MCYGTQALRKWKALTAKHLVIIELIIIIYNCAICNVTIIIIIMKIIKC